MGDEFQFLEELTFTPAGPLKVTLPNYLLVSYDKTTDTEKELGRFVEKTNKKIFAFMKAELKGKPNVNNYYVVTEYNDYTCYKNGNYEFRLYNIKH